MRRIVVVLGAAGALLVSAASASAAVVPVNSLAPPFAATNPSVRETPQGVNFGVYADAGRTGGSLEYDGANGQTFGSLTGLGYTYNYNTSDDNPLGAPYLRVFLDANGDGVADDDVIFDPTLCGTVAPPENVDHTVDVTTQTVRFDDDACGAAAQQVPFATLRANPVIAAETIVGIFVTQGFSGGQDASAYVRNLTVNATTFAFDVPPAAGAPGPAGVNGVVVQQVPGATPVAPPAAGVAGVQATRTCRGAVVRRLHAPNRKGERFLRVAAGLATPTGFRSLPVSGRSITVDLTGKPEANYNVRLISRYRTKSGKVRRVVTRRNLSVACS